MRVHIQTYGCSNNIAESRSMADILTKSGYAISDFDSADIVIVNTCSVKSVTENRIFYRLNSINDNYPEKKLIVAGCMPESEYEKIRGIVPDASLVSTHHIDKIVDVVNSVLRGEYIEVLGKNRLDKARLSRKRPGPVDIIPISSGCRSFCTFCSTKIAKGDLFSFPQESIASALKKGVKHGSKEFWITSQDNGCYGFDRNTNLAELIREITKIDGEYKLRIGMMNPEHLTKFLPELIEAYKSEKVFKFLHLPVQSGSDSVLKRMGRRHTIDEFRHIIREFRSVFPYVTIWTDMIVGFPGESEEDFEASMNLIEDIGFDFVNVSAYGNRPKTLASRMNQIPTQVKKERTRKMSTLVRSLSKKANEKWIGWSGRALVDEYNDKKKTWVARNYAYKPVVIKGDFSLGDEIFVLVHETSSNALFAVTQEKERSRFPASDKQLEE